jgi:predicted nucleic acid-binding protein
MLRYLLVTNNTGEFEQVPVLEVENWVHTAQ